ncbi:MAG: ComEC/Rec2 family competence protein [Dermatophilaceae bacterium]
MRRLLPDRESATRRFRVDLRLLLPALTAWAACASTLGWSPKAKATVAVGATVLAALAVWRGRPRHGRRSRAWLLLGLTGAALALVIGASASADELRRSGTIPELAADHAVATVTGVVIGEPVSAKSTGGRSADRVFVRVRVDAITGRGQTSRVQAPVLVVADHRWSSLGWHDRISARLRLSPAGAADDVLATGRALAAPVVARRAGWVYSWSERPRAALRNAMAGLPGDAAGLVPGMVIGDTTRSPPELTADMRATGLTHLSAVSGANVAILIAAVTPMIRVVGVRRRWRPPVLGALLVAFVLLARPEPSVLRAAAMGAIGLLGTQNSRRAAGVPALAGAVLALLVIDPWLARSYGFALSTLATLGLLLFTRPWAARLRPWLPCRLAGLAEALAIPIAAQAMCAPVIVMLSGSVSLVGVPANLVVAPLVAPVTLGGIGVMLGALIWPAAAHLAAWIPAVPALGIGAVAHWGADQAWGSMPWPKSPTGAMGLAGLTLVLLLVGPRLADIARRRPIPAAACLAASVGIAVPTTPVLWPPTTWAMVTCDVGQGDAIVLHSGPGRAVLIDAGPDSRLVDHCLGRLGVRALDAVVLTHFHADHIDGLLGAIAGRRVSRIVVSPVADPPDGAATVDRLAQARGIPMDVVQVGERFVWGDVRARVWWPERAIHEGSVPNNASVVLDASVGDLDVLLSGDIEREAGRALLLALRRDPAAYARLGSYEVLKAPHHGSSNLDRDLLAAVHARAAVISVGADNDYGHPAPSTLSLLKGEGMQVYRTDRDGDVAFWMVGATLMAATARGSP